MTSARPWLTSYAPGVPVNIDPDIYPSVAKYYDERFDKFKKRPAFECMGKSLSFGEINQLSDQFGAYLQSRGLEKGDKVALMMPNLLQYPVALFALLKTGMIVVNTNPLYTAREMEHQFKDSQVKAIVICENFAHNLEKIIDNTDIKIVVTASIGEMLGSIKGKMVNFAVRNIKRMVPKFTIPNTVTFKDALSQGKKFSITRAEGRGDDVIIHQYTGGTTGVSKGAMLTNRNIMANILQMQVTWSELIVPGKEVILTALPLYHIFALTVNCLGVGSMGACNILITNARDLPTVIKAFEEKSITVFTGVNTLFNALTNSEDFVKLDFSKLKLTAAGGMALQNAVAINWKEKTNTEVLEGYGLTESSPAATFNPIHGKSRLGTIGIPLSSTVIKIADEQGNEMPYGEVGEIYIQGPQVMKGYFNRPDETAKVLKDGWLLTGDMGIMDEDGFIKIVDRKKDMIIVSGFNVYPNEIEDVVAMHPKVLEVAAIGIPSEKSGEQVKIFVVKKDKSLKEDELIQHCREHLTGYKVPKSVEFRKDLPKTNVGKILRRELREKS